MGKEKATAVLSETKGKLMPSTAMSQQLASFSSQGYQLSHVHIAWQSSVLENASMAETSSMSCDDESVLFMMFIIYGMLLPVHEFFCGLMYFYQV